MNILSLHPLRDEHTAKIKAACPDAELHIAKDSECEPCSLSVKRISRLFCQKRRSFAGCKP